MIHKILDKIDRIVAQKRASGDLDAWIESGSARLYCETESASHRHYYPALILYVEQRAGRG